MASSGQRASLGTLLCPGSWGEGLGWRSRLEAELDLASPGQCGSEVKVQERGVGRRPHFTAN